MKWRMLGKTVDGAKVFIGRPWRSVASRKFQRLWPLLLFLFDRGRYWKTRAMGYSSEHQKVRGLSLIRCERKHQLQRELFWYFRRRHPGTSTRWKWFQARKRADVLTAQQRRK